MVHPPRIAVLVPNFLAVTRAVLGGIGQYTREHAPWTIVNNPWQQAERGLELPPVPIDGVILCFPDILKGRRGRKVPTVLVTERFVDAALPRVIPDSAAIGRPRPPAGSGRPDGQRRIRTRTGTSESALSASGGPSWSRSWILLLALWLFTRCCLSMAQGEQSLGGGGRCLVTVGTGQRQRTRCFFAGLVGGSPGQQCVGKQRSGQAFPIGRDVAA